MQTAILNNPSSRAVEDLTDAMIGTWAICYDCVVSDAIIAGRVYAVVPDTATEEQIGQALREAQRRRDVE